MKLTSTNRPFGLTIKFTWHHVYTPACAEIGAWLVKPRARWRTSQRAELDGAPALKSCDSFRKIPMLFSCEIIASGQWLVAAASLTSASGWSSLQRASIPLLDCHPGRPSADEGSAAPRSRRESSLQDWRYRFCVESRLEPSCESRSHAPTKPVILPQGKHPFPSRTRKLSPAGPIVLHAKVCGRVGRRRHK